MPRSGGNGAASGDHDDNITTAQVDRKLLPLSVGRWGPGLRLFCLPSAGSGAVMFQNWLSGASDGFEVQYARITRSRGAAGGSPRRPADLEMFAGELAAEMRPLVSPPFAIFGHSFGATLGFRISSAVDAGRFRTRVPVRFCVSPAPCCTKSDA